MPFWFLNPEYPCFDKKRERRLAGTPGPGYLRELAKREVPGFRSNKNVTDGFHRYQAGLLQAGSAFFSVVEFESGAVDIFGNDVSSRWDETIKKSLRTISKTDSSAAIFSWTGDSGVAPGRMFVSIASPFKSVVFFPAVEFE
jgi:hypothetical protein